MPAAQSDSINPHKLGIVLSGGGSRAAYQVGALKALQNYIESHNKPISVIVGSSIGAVNGILLGACVKAGLAQAIKELEDLWMERTFRNTFSGSPSMAFLRAVKVAVLNYATNPGPHATEDAIFDPTPLMNRMDRVLEEYGGLGTDSRDPDLEAVAVMTTIEGETRKPLLFLSAQDNLEEELLQGASFQVHEVEELSAKHGFASAALPTVLPPVKLDIDGGSVSLVDGGISQNIPVDPAVRLGANHVIVIDVSGRDWWLDHYGEPHYTRPDWEVPADMETFCLRPPEYFLSRCQRPLGPLLKEAVGGNNKDFIQALGATWPIYSLIKKKLGEDLAYEVMTYVALHPDYAEALIERGYNETSAMLRDKLRPQFTTLDEYRQWYAG